MELFFQLLYNVNYFTLATIALKASGWFIAKSARTLRLISIPALHAKLPSDESKTFLPDVRQH